MVDLAMSIFEFLTKFWVFWHPWHPWVCIRSDLKPLFETDMSDFSFSEWVLEKSLNLRFSKSRTKVGVSENLKSEVFKVIYYSEQ